MAFLVEMGIEGNVFNQDFKKYGCLATHGTWFKNLWEFAHYSKKSIVLDKKHHLQPSRAGDCPVMELFIQANLRKEQILRFALVRKHKKVIMLSEALRCDDRGIGPLMLTREKGHSDRMTSPMEKPMKKDFNLWEASIENNQFCQPATSVSVGYPSSLQWYVISMVLRYYPLRTLPMTTRQDRTDLLCFCKI